jgi:hypothetical protein
VELFEILFILFFILIPVLEGIRKSKQRRDAPDIEEPTSARPRPAPPRTGAPPRRMPEQEAEPGEAADMVPDDLWEILTGERRQAPAPAEPRAEDEDWYQEAEEAVEETYQAEEERWAEEPVWEREEDPRAPERFEPAPWRDERTAWDEEVPFQPEEALIVPEERRARPARARISLRTVVDAPRTKREVSPLMKALQNPDGLRQAVLLKEILGPPRGLDS